MAVIRSLHQKSLMTDLGLYAPIRDHPKVVSKRDPFMGRKRTP